MYLRPITYMIFMLFFFTLHILLRENLEFCVIVLTIVWLERTGFLDTHQYTLDGCIYIKHLILDVIDKDEKQSFMHHMCHSTASCKIFPATLGHNDKKLNFKYKHKMWNGVFFHALVNLKS